MKRPIDAIAWMKRLEEEKEETNNPKRKTYLDIQINSIVCQREMEISDIIRYLEEKTGKEVVLQDKPRSKK